MNAKVLEDHSFMELTDNELYFTEGGKPFWKKLVKGVVQVAVVATTTVGGAVLGFDVAGVPGAIVGGAAGVGAGLELVD